MAKKRSPIFVLCALTIAGQASAAPPPKTTGPPCDRDSAQQAGVEPKRCRASLTFSPVHLEYGFFLLSSEIRLFERLSIAADSGLGSTRGATMSQLGGWLAFYPVGTFDLGLQLGPFARLTRFQFPHGHDIKPSSYSAFYSDLNDARLAGRDALFAGVLVGGKGIFPRGAGPFRGLTVQSGFRLGQLRMLGETRSDVEPYENRRTYGFHSMIYLDLGWSF